MAVSTFGIGAPNYPTQSSPGFAPPYLQSLSTLPSTGYGASGSQPFHHILQSLQVVFHQLQQLQWLEQQQLAYIQQLLQVVPAQLQHLQQLIQLGPQQLAQLQQPYGPALSSPLGFGLSPQPFAGQPTPHIM